MKKIQSLLISAATIMMVACNKDTAEPAPQLSLTQQVNTIPNGNFESWSELLPQSWKTNSCPACVSAFETYIVRKDSGSYQGQFAAKFIYNNFYRATAINKFPLATHPNVLTAYVKCSLYGADTVSVKIRLLKNSMVVDSGQWTGTAPINSYSLVLIPLTNNSPLADSAVISIGGGRRIGYPANNSVLWIDNLLLD
jgi:hypothetical protein